MDTPNLDCMEQSELRNLAGVLRKLAHYASQKACAMDWRAKGDIKMALLAEAVLDKLYQEIPEEYRW